MEKVDFLATDGIELNGLLYKNETNTNKIIIAVHGMTSNCFKKRDDVIAKYANRNNIDYFCFNNRGSELAKYIRGKINGRKIKALGGMSYENVLESYNDVLGAIKKMLELGYKEIYLQGHSLGSTKVVYTYNKLLEENDLQILSTIKGMILLSLVDIPSVLKFFLKDKFESYVKLAEEKVEEGSQAEIMPKESFIHPVSAGTFLQYARDYKDFDFINIIEDENLEILNNISIPIFMRWGSVQELILQEAEQYSKNVRNIIKNKQADIDFIYGADHGYHGKEEILAEQIMKFLDKI